MNKTKQVLPALAIAVLALSSFTFHPAPASRKATIIAAWERAKVYTKEYLDAATEEVYDFKPTPEMRSFGGQMHHLAVDNYNLVKAATGGGGTAKFVDLEKVTLKTKAEITTAVMESYDYAIATIKGLDDSKLDAPIKMFDKFDTTVEDGLNKAFEHQTHHRGQTTVYLRLKGITPPQEKLF